MKTMKKFSYLLTVALATIIGFASCSSDDDHDGTNPNPSGSTKTITLSVETSSNAQLRADGVTAAGKTPNVNDLSLYFFDASNVIQSVQAFPISGSAPATGNQSFTVPSTVTGVYAVGNVTATMANSIVNLSSIVPSSTVANLEALLIDMSKQTDPTTAVTVKGSTASLSTATPNSLSISAAVARIEIAKIESDGATGAKVPLTAFTVENIYINNTYTKFALNETDPTTTASEIVNFDKSTWTTTWGTGGNVPSIFKDPAINKVATGTIPTVTPTNAVWGYFVPANTGTTTGTTFPNPTDASTPVAELQPSGVPHIVVALSGVTASNGMTYAGTQYVTVKGFKASGTSLKNLKHGYYYTISSLNIGAEHLSPNPEEPTVSLEIEVTVQPWLPELVTPEF